MKHLESKEQMAVIEWAQYVSIPGTKLKVIDCLIAIPNDGIRAPKHGNLMKKLGLKPGVSDLFLAYPQVNIGGLWIEMKKRRSDFSSRNEAAKSVSVDQAEWAGRMLTVGYMAKTCFGADEAIEQIKMYLGISK